MFDLRGDVLDYRCVRDERCEAERRVGRPSAMWLLAALIAVVLGGAVLLASITPDTRDFAARHQSVLKARVI